MSPPNPAISWVNLNRCPREGIIRSSLSSKVNSYYNDASTATITIPSAYRWSLAPPQVTICSKQHFLNVATQLAREGVSMSAQHRAKYKLTQQLKLVGWCTLERCPSNKRLNPTLPNGTWRSRHICLHSQWRLNLKWEKSKDDMMWRKSLGDPNAFRLNHQLFSNSQN